MSDVQAAALDAAPGVAVIQLPKPDEDVAMQDCAGAGQPFEPNTLSRDGEVAKCSECGTGRYVCDDGSIEPHQVSAAAVDNDEYDRLLTRQSELLTGVVNAIRGNPPELTTWSHHDAPELARDLAAEVSRLRAQETRIRALADEWFKQARDPSFDNTDPADDATTDTLNECAFEVYDAIGALDDDGRNVKPAALDTEGEDQ